MTNAVSPAVFAIEYSVVDSFETCLPDEGPQLVWSSNSTTTDDQGRTVYDGAYSVPYEVRATRTVCTTDVAEPAPCGFPAAVAVVAALIPD